MVLLDSNTPLIGSGTYLVGEFAIDKPKLIRAIGLGVTDKACIKILDAVQIESASFELDGCGITTPSPKTLKATEYIKDCGSKICLCEKQPWAVIGLNGNYVLEVSGTNIDLKQVKIEIVDQPLPFSLFSYCKDCG
jgi:hypothetical protein